MRAAILHEAGTAPPLQPIADERAMGVRERRGIEKDGKVIGDAGGVIEDAQAAADRTKEYLGQ